MGIAAKKGYHLLCPPFSTLPDVVVTRFSMVVLLGILLMVVCFGFTTPDGVVLFSLFFSLTNTVKYDIIWYMRR